MPSKDPFPYNEAVIRNGGKKLMLRGKKHIGLACDLHTISN